MIIGRGYETGSMSPEKARAIVEEALRQTDLADRGVLVIIPDSTRNAPVPQFFRWFATS